MPSVAEQVVAEISKAGGKAVANGDSVADPLGAERIIKTAIDNFGRIDCVVNNAGILRDRIFHRMSVVDWDAVIKVHLYGAFYMSKAAAPYFKEQESGSFVHFTSTSGLVGNFGQANYAAAKLGIVGLSKSIALDMARFNVRSNCVSPFAWSRLIGTIPTDTPEEKARVERIQNTMTASKIAPICVFLASDLSKDVTGQIFAVRKDEIFLMSQSRPDARGAQGRRLDAASDRRHHAAGVQERASIRSTARPTCSTGSRCDRSGRRRASPRSNTASASVRRMVWIPATQARDDGSRVRSMAEADDVGILAFGAYLPRLRLSRKAVAEANAWFNPGLKGLAKGERTMCNWDEDTVTMAVEAARDCLTGQDRGTVGVARFRLDHAAVRGPPERRHRRRGAEPASPTSTRRTSPPRSAPPPRG